LTASTARSPSGVWSCSDLDGLLDEFGSYSRVTDDAGETTEKIADKENYHRLDAVRYIVGWLRRGMADGVPTSPPRPGDRRFGRWGDRPSATARLSGGANGSRGGKDWRDRLLLIRPAMLNIRSLSS
jgi:hypothetical protein